MLKDVIKDIVYNQSQRLIEDDPQEYFLRKEDAGYINNGAGWVLCEAPENVYDEERAFENAKEKIIENIDDFDFDIFIENEKFIDELKRLIRSL